MTDFDRRRAIAVGGTALTVALAGCSYFEDTEGVPGTNEAVEDDGESPAGDESADEGPAADEK